MTVELLKEKSRECAVNSRAFEIWLDFLKPFRWGTVVIGVVFPALAGFSVLKNVDILGVDWEVIAMSLTFAASIVTALHAALHCDAHQATCSKFAPLYSSLADDFELAASLDEKSRAKREQELFKRLSDLKKSTLEKPARWAYKKAEAQIPAA